MRRIRIPALSVMWCFVVTLALFPGITSDLLSTNASINLPITDINPTGSGWFPLILVSIFNMGDFFGRSFPSFYMAPWKAVLVGGVIRTAFFPLFIANYKVKLKSKTDINMQ